MHISGVNWHAADDSTCLISPFEGPDEFELKLLSTTKNINVIFSHCCVSTSVGYNTDFFCRRWTEETENRGSGQTPDMCERYSKLLWSVAVCLIHRVVDGGSPCYVG